MRPEQQLLQDDTRTAVACDAVCKWLVDACCMISFSFFLNSSRRKVPPELVPNLLTKFAPIKFRRCFSDKAVLEAPEQQDMRGRE